MPRRLFAGTLIALLSILIFAVAQEEDGPGIVDTGPHEVLTYTQTDIEWQPGPGSLAEGAEFSLLEGDPSQQGLFALRIRMPDGFRIEPHWHPNVERLTVISGTFRLGHGDEFDAGATDPFGPGSYLSLPPEMTHFAVTEGTTEVQLTSIGPWVINYVNPEDDPRN